MSNTFMYRTLEPCSGPGRVEAVSVTSRPREGKYDDLTENMPLFIDTVVL